MNLEKIENLVYKEKIELFEYPMNNAKARLIRNNMGTSIFIDKNKINDTIEKKCVLAEELGHYYCDALYSPLYYDKHLIDKNEYKATKWAFKTLINKEKLISLLKLNLNKFEIAEELGVTEELLEKACNYYFNN